MPAVCLETHAIVGLGISLGAFKVNTKIEALDLDNAVSFCLNDYEACLGVEEKPWVDYHQVAKAPRLARTQA